jgi:hypothetical protein
MPLTQEQADAWLKPLQRVADGHANQLQTLLKRGAAESEYAELLPLMERDYRRFLTQVERLIAASKADQTRPALLNYYDPGGERRDFLDPLEGPQIRERI